jgi:FdhD protein
MSRPATVVAVRRVDGTGTRVDHDLVATEAPLSVVVTQPGAAPVPLGILMRTPGHDDDLVVGFLHAEGIISRASDVVSVAADDDRLDVTLAPGCDLPAIAARAQIVSSACGLCGRLAVAALDRRHGAPPPMRPIDVRRIAAVPGLLHPHQAVFAETGGLHAAALLDPDGGLRLLREDVGRHNAVDKTIGAALREGAVPLHGYWLAVSGRVAYEIVQKAAMASIPLLIAVGAPTDLAIEAARAARITLVGFARDGRFNVYTHPDRIDATTTAP